MCGIELLVFSLLRLAWIHGILMCGWTEPEVCALMRGLDRHFFDAKGSAHSFSLAVGSWGDGGLGCRSASHGEDRLWVGVTTEGEGT